MNSTDLQTKSAELHQNSGYGKNVGRILSISAVTALNLKETVESVESVDLLLVYEDKYNSTHQQFILIKSVEYVEKSTDSTHCLHTKNRLSTYQHKEKKT